jgi:hypothetical protein
LNTRRKNSEINSKQLLIGLSSLVGGPKKEDTHVLVVSVLVLLRDGPSQPSLRDVAEFFGEKGRIFQFLGGCNIIFDEKWQKIFRFC